MRSIHQSCNSPTRRGINHYQDLIRVLKELPEDDAKEMMQRIVLFPQDFKRFFPSVNELINAVKELPEYCSEQLMRRVFTNQQEFSRLMSNTADLFTAVRLLPDKYASELVLRVRSLLGETILHMAAKFDPSLIPLALKNGAEATAEDAYGNTAIELLMAKDKFLPEYIGPALSLIHNGADYTVRNKSGNNILQLIYEIFPTVKNYLLSQGIAKDKLEDPGHVFKNIDIELLRKEIIQQAQFDKVFNKEYTEKLANELAELRKKRAASVYQGQVTLFRTGDLNSSLVRLTEPDHVSRTATP